MTEYSEVSKIEPGEAVTKKAAEILAKLQTINSDEVVCMIGLVITADGGDPANKSRLHGFALGDDNDMAKMFSALVSMTRDGIVKANTPTDETEVKH